MCTILIIVGIVVVLCPIFMFLGLTPANNDKTTNKEKPDKELDFVLDENGNMVWYEKRKK